MVCVKGEGKQMKVRLTIMTENDRPVEALGDNPERKIWDAWDAVLKFMNKCDKDGASAHLENVEIVRDEVTE